MAAVLRNDSLHLLRSSFLVAATLCFFGGLKWLPLAEGSAVEVRLGDREAPVVATVPVTGTVGEWTDVSADLSGVTGVHDVYFTFTGAEDTDLVEVDTWSFVEAEDDAPAL